MSPSQPEQSTRTRTRTRTRLLFTLAGSMAFGICATAEAQMKVTFTGNNGVMLSAGGKSIVIDTLQNHTNTFWTRLPQAELSKLTRGLAPFDSVLYALATHNHPDHYARNPVLSFLANNPDAMFVGSQQIRNNLGAHEQSIVVSPLFQTGSIVITDEPGLRIEVFHMEHFDQFGNDFSRVENYTYLVTMGGVSVLHLGDVDYVAENFENYSFANREIDAIVLPMFNTLLSEANRDLVMSQIQPRHIIGTHLRANSLNVDEARARELYPNATIFHIASESITLEPRSVQMPLSGPWSLAAFTVVLMVIGARLIVRRSRKFGSVRSDSLPACG